MGSFGQPNSNRDVKQFGIRQKNLRYRKKMVITVHVLSPEAYRLVKAIDLVEHDIEFKKIPDDIGESLHAAMDTTYYRIADLLEDAYEQNVNP